MQDRTYKDVNNFQEDYVSKNIYKEKIVCLRDVKPGQEFYFASDASRDTCVSYGRPPNGRFSVVNMCESPDSNYGESPGIQRFVW